MAQTPPFFARPVKQAVYDPNTMTWVPMEQPGAGGGGGAVTIADGADVNAGFTTDVAVTTDTSGTLSGKLRGLVKWAFERMPASLGQKTMAASLPVVVASDQSAVPISAASLPLPTGATTEATLGTRALEAGGNLAGVRTAVEIIDDWDETDRAKVNPIVGQAGVQGGAGAVSATTQRIAVATDANVVSTKTDLAPASPTAASVGVASATAVAANASRKGLILVNTSAARISLGFGAAAVLDSGVTLYPGGVYNMGEYDFDLGAVNAIASAAASNLAIQEYS